MGIPAYNEEANIKQLLESLLNQTQENWELLEIIVVSDKSSDRTVEKIREVNNEKIRLIENEVRIGQALSQNKILKLFSGDILILLNADIMPSGILFVEKIISPFSESDIIGIVSPDSVPLKASTFFEKVINYSVDYKKEMFKSLNQGNNLFMCVGAARAFNGSMIRKMEWPTSLSEDAYSYLFCINSNYKFVYFPSASIYYKSPDNLEDHLKQSTRFLNGPSIMEKYFPKDLVKNNYYIPLFIKIKSSLHFLVLNPVFFLFYIGVLAISKIKSNTRNNSKDLWSTSTSSKTLIIK